MRIKSIILFASLHLLTIGFFGIIVVVSTPNYHEKPGFINIVASDIVSVLIEPCYTIWKQLPSEIKIDFIEWVLVLSCSFIWSLFIIFLIRAWMYISFRCQRQNSKSMNGLSPSD